MSTRRDALGLVEDGEARRDLRSEATWDHLVYAGAPMMRDTGCRFHAACLTCPFVRCKFEEGPGGRSVLQDELAGRRFARALEVRRMRDAGMDVDAIASAIGRGRRTVWRLLAS